MYVARLNVIYLKYVKKNCHHLFNDRFLIFSEFLKIGYTGTQAKI